MTTELQTQHEWVAFTMTPVQPIVDPQTGEVSFFDDPNMSAITTYGCAACNMGVEEGMENNCPGFDLFDEDTVP